MRLPPEEARRRFASSVVATLGTVSPQGGPHLVPVVFALRGDRILISVDPKPKRGTELQRLRDIAAEPRVQLLVQHYAEDWEAIWWARAEGLAQVLRAGPEREAAIQALREKYPQYRRLEGEFGPAVVVDAALWSGWSFS